MILPAYLNSEIKKKTLSTLINSIFIIFMISVIIKLIPETQFYEDYEQFSYTYTYNLSDDKLKVLRAIEKEEGTSSNIVYLGNSNGYDIYADTRSRIAGRFSTLFIDGKKVVNNFTYRKEFFMATALFTIALGLFIYFSQILYGKLKKHDISGTKEKKFFKFSLSTLFIICLFLNSIWLTCVIPFFAHELLQPALLMFIMPSILFVGLFVIATLMHYLDNHERMSLIDYQDYQVDAFFKENHVKLKMPKSVIKHFMRTIAKLDLAKSSCGAKNEGLQLYCHSSIINEAVMELRNRGGDEIIEDILMLPYLNEEFTDVLCKLSLQIRDFEINKKK